MWVSSLAAKSVDFYHFTRSSPCSLDKLPAGSLTQASCAFVRGATSFCRSVYPVWGLLSAPGYRVLSALRGAPRGFPPRPSAGEHPHFN
jgi:hypothetical protein